MPTAFYSIPRTKRRKKQRNKERNKDRIWIGNFLEDHIQLDIHGKSLALHIINWMQIKPTKSYDITHVQMSSLGKMGDSKCWREWRMTTSLHTLWREACAAIGESSMGASQEKNALLHGWVLSEWLAKLVLSLLSLETVKFSTPLWTAPNPKSSSQHKILGTI